MKFTGNRNTKNGLLQERSTIEEYKLKKAEEGENVIVESSGLIISKDHPYLAGSPDGIVTTSSGNTGLIEIKNLLHSKPINLHQASENSNFCLINKKGTLYLKENHIYYHQCQGLMNICNFEWIDLVVRTLNPYQMIIHRIIRDKDFWNNTMLPKLHAFYFNCLLPELASPREGKSPGIREPGVWYTPPAAPQITKQGRRSRAKKRSTADTDTDTETDCTSDPTPCKTQRSSRKKSGSVKFVGRRISHEWVIDEQKGLTEWYPGTVVSLLSGKDGEPGAVYEVLYDDDEEPYEVDHLTEDLKSSSVKFLDI
ncbi:hypothetical protein FSP39_013237 [Pinctada imbricata]|uniref:YqaJ viral recombinase domain-containing protein n=1 Tax=Pinctada imbricata TaxID=66713 RepID=A0AA88YCW1_PINIB|nr:hypothetical protein FSP39_013237 [Pinctada imbricata]